MTHFEQWAERRWRCVRDLTVAMMRGAILRVSTPDGLVTAGRGSLHDWRAVPSGDLSCGPGAPDALVAYRLSTEIDVVRLRRALRAAQRDGR